MKIAVGSTNPVKIAAVRSVVERIWPEAQVEGVAVPSGVSEMPMSEAETIIGAQNRAKAARQQLTADLGIGLEGGLHEEPFGWALQGWVAVVVVRKTPPVSRVRSLGVEETVMRSGVVRSPGPRR